MGYGALITNSRGQQTVYGGEKAYLYWGKKTVTCTAGQEGTFALFNIPSGASPMIFIKQSNTAYDTGGVIDTRIWTYYSSNKLRIKWVNKHPWAQFGSKNKVKTFTLTVYVFVTANYVSLPSYGMWIKNDNGEIAFHTGRPQLDIKKTYALNQSKASGNVGQNKLSRYGAESYDIAICPVVKGCQTWFYSRFGDFGDIDLLTWSVTAVGRQMDWNHYAELVHDGYKPDHYYKNWWATTVYAPIISSSYYDQFSSLGNM